ncbi:MULTISPECIES: DUF4064 domain-containing protein [Virgibacillus]|uniref:DUF4064 domain-containing protein n=2 Tax=Virgibacillus TaxID=84406 RepID=A0A024Q7N6_9BACI|nr:MULTISPECIES: DUF4064 domain-containing protein [Virgibacillus]EQB38553.1 hypothetical protein M948_08180 [Virgibacillus sp. CM-4]CDQ37936.1 hypothetical protein BN990_00202 [Virgibacillus massiliensis]BCT36557.1 DUF4064 domain-containing protein [Virgibacillus massiliensis]BCT36576.1 DUF4064 domain-containing protein [Virgibacillus salexigens]GGJ55649.1 hypothetical protein GCM10007111_17450 [Virgibacillus kapii]
MKRTAEILLTVIGVIIFSFLLIGSVTLLGSTQNNAQTKELVQEFIKDENITAVNADQVVNFLSNSTLYFVVISLISIGLGVISIILLKRNKAKTAGKVLIITAILSTLFTLFMGLFGGIAYFIAGVMALVRNKR